MSTRDYKRRGSTEPKRRTPNPRGSVPRRWPWFAAGFVCGLLVAFVAYLKEYSPETLRLVASQSALRDEAHRQKEPAARADGKPRFEFYTLLPEMEVTVPERELEAAAARERRTAAPATASQPEPPTPAAASSAPAAGDGAAVASADTGTSTYMLQVASFRRIEDADRLKATLALTGLVATIQTVLVNGEDTYFRVRVGPYTDVANLNDARARLREQNLEPLVLKVRG